MSQDLRAQAEQRLAELRPQLAAVEERIARLEQEVAEARALRMRIDGAIQVLEEMLGQG